MLKFQFIFYIEPRLGGQKGIVSAIGMNSNMPGIYALGSFSASSNLCHYSLVFGVSILFQIIAL